MQVVVRCTQQQQQELLEKTTAANVEFVFTGDNQIDFINTSGDVFFDLIVDEQYPVVDKTDVPVFVNAVVLTSRDLPANYIRMNAWSSFLKRDIVEVSTQSLQDYVEQTMQALGWKYQFVPDEPGMVAPRIVAMIVNEAYFGLEDSISTKDEIDTAMKLGTNYPYGPFEWAEKIGKQQILLLLQTLCRQDGRYAPAQLLVDEASSITQF